ncbi:MAG: putative Ig domain-containing protein [Bacteroidota bacterium]
MKKQLLRFLLLTTTCMQLLSAVHAQEIIDYKGFPQWSWQKEDSTEYYIYTPSNIQAGKRYPIVLFLHGCCGTDNHATLRNAVDPPVRAWHNFGENTQSVPTYIIAPGTSRGWRQHFTALKKVMDDLIKNKQGDPQRVYITGFSMGGAGTWDFITRYPGFFAAAIPLGANANADAVKAINIPIWTSIGELDPNAKKLRASVTALRNAIGDYVDSNQSWVTGSNPRFTQFTGMGHGIQWKAVTKQDITGWAYSKLNNGNNYPNVVFITPTYRQKIRKGSMVDSEVNAFDSDGGIRKIMVYINNVYLKTINKTPYRFSFKAGDGDTKIEATAYDDKGKTATATTWIKADNKPTLSTAVLPYARQGALYNSRIMASGNGHLRFGVNEALPKGLILYPDGLIKGLPSETGTFIIKANIKDEDGDETNINLPLEIKNKRVNELIPREVITNEGKKLPVSKMIYGETPNFNSRDTVFSTDTDELNFSGLGNFYGLSFIKTDPSDANNKDNDYLSFTIDQDAELLVAYEKTGKQFSSTIPSWLESFTKIDNAEIVNQYRYYGIYSKKLKKGTITLQGADAKNNKVQSNYFLMFRGLSAQVDLTPEINTTALPSAASQQYYSQQLTALYGHGHIHWDISGRLPKGMRLSDTGSLSGIPEAKGTFSIQVIAKDDTKKKSTANLKLVVK